MRRDSFYYKPSIKALQSTLLFHGANEDLLDDILNYFTPMTIPKKTMISLEQIEVFFFVVIRGRVKFSQVCSKTAREYITNIFTTGDIFDTISLLYPENDDLFIETIDNTWLLKTSAKTAKKLLYNHPIFNENIFSYFGKKMFEMQDFTKELIFYDTSTRLARLIVRHFEAGTLYLIEDLSIDMISKMVGSSRKVINLHMLELKKEGIISNINRKLVVKNIEKLYRKASMGQK